MEDGVKFCPSCGTPVGAAASVAAKPATEKVGTIRKCPACGAEVPAMTALCPDCGHEFSNVQVSNTVKTFVERINALDAEIAVERDNRIQTTTSLGKKIGYVILNIYTFAIPFILRTLKRALFPTVPQLLPSEQKKKSLIENFVVPNNREDIMEFILFVSAKMDSEASTSGVSIDNLGLANMWTKMWADKCNQLYAKAGVVLSGDPKTLTTINSLMERPQKMMAQAKRKVLIKTGGVAGVVFVAALITIIYVLGIGVKVPSSTLIPPDKTLIGGDFEGYLRPADNGIALSAGNKGEVNLSMPVEAVKDIRPVIEEQLAEFIQSKGWNAADCSYTLDVSYYGPGSWIGIRGFKIETNGGDFKLDGDEVESVLSSLLKMKPGETKKIVLDLSPGADMPGGRKKNAARLMKRKDLELIISLGYRIKNNANNSSDTVAIR
jgi:hypothetical protein